MPTGTRPSGRRCISSFGSSTKVAISPPVVSFVGPLRPTVGYSAGNWRGATMAQYSRRLLTIFVRWPSQPISMAAIMGVRSGQTTWIT